MDYHHITLLCSKLLQFERWSELLTLRTLCRKVCMTITKSLIEHNQNSGGQIYAKKSMIFYNQCMSCSEKTDDTEVRCLFYDTVYMKTQEVVFCKKILCRIAVLIAASKGFQMSNANLFCCLQFDSQPMCVKRSNGSIDYNWKWCQRSLAVCNDGRINLLMMSPRLEVKWCSLSDLVSINKGVRFKPFEILCHAECSFGRDHIDVEQSLISKLKSLDIEIEPYYGLFYPVSIYSD